MGVLTLSSRFKLTSRFAFRDPMLLLARARLAEDQLELSGWQIRGRYRRSILLDQIVHVDVTGVNNLVIWLRDGEVVRLRIEEAAAWKRALSPGL